MVQPVTQFTNIQNLGNTSAVTTNPAAVATPASIASATNENSLVSFSSETDVKKSKINSEIKMQNMLIQSYQNIITMKESQLQSARRQLGLTKDKDQIKSINSKIKTLNTEIGTLCDNLIAAMFTINAKNSESSALSSLAAAQALSATNAVNTNAADTGATITSGSTLGSNILANAKKYLGYNESNGSYKKFTEGRAEAWCADFVTYVTKETYKGMGLQIPSGFGSPAVNTIKAWGQNNGRWISKDNLNSVKPGDIMIQPSHTGFVISVNGDGTVTTIEGNTSDTVAVRTQKLSSITGFVSIA